MHRRVSAAEQTPAARVLCVRHRDSVWGGGGRETGRRHVRAKTSVPVECVGQEDREGRRQPQRPGVRDAGSRFASGRRGEGACGGGGGDCRRGLQAVPWPLTGRGGRGAPGGRGVRTSVGFLNFSFGDSKL